MQQSGQQDLFELVTAARGGDRTAFAKLCERQCAKILYTCMGLMQNREDAEDATQEILVRMHKSIRKLRATEAYSAWLSRITLSVCNNMRRENLKRRNILPIDELETGYQSDVLQFLTPNYVENRENREELLHAIAGLTYHQRACIYLYYYQDLSYKEIADVLGMTVRGVEGCIFRAKKAVKAELALPNGTPMHGGMDFGAVLAAVFAADTASTISEAQVQSCIRAAGLPTPAGGAGLLAGFTTAHKAIVGTVLAAALVTATAAAFHYLPTALAAPPDEGPPRPHPAVTSVLDGDTAAAPLGPPPSSAASAPEEGAAVPPAILLEGGVGAGGHVNPQAIVADTDDDTCAWQIEDAQGAVVGTGSGARIEAEVAALQQARADGVYTVRFTVRRGGASANSTADFRIYSGEIEPGMFG